jgi:uncharacterized protein YaaW (UPF0174 family)
MVNLIIVGEDKSSDEYKAAEELSKHFSSEHSPFINSEGQVYIWVGQQILNTEIDLIIIGELTNAELFLDNRNVAIDNFCFTFEIKSHTDISKISTRGNALLVDDKSVTDQSRNQRIKLTEWFKKEFNFDKKSQPPYIHNFIWWRGLSKETINNSDTKIKIAMKENSLPAVFDFKDLFELANNKRKSIFQEHFNICKNKSGFEKILKYLKEDDKQNQQKSTINEDIADGYDIDNDLQILETFSNIELDVLVQKIKTKWSEELTTTERYKKFSPQHVKYIDIIAKEICLFGGNTFTNLYRGKGKNYRDIVINVAKKLKVNFNKEQPIEEIEENLLQTVMDKSFQKMSDEKKEEFLKSLDSNGVYFKAGMKLSSAVLNSIFIQMLKSGGFYTYQMAVVIANNIARLITGRALQITTSYLIPQVLKRFILFSGPIMWTITAVWLIFDISSPAYKILTPLVIYIAALRQIKISKPDDSCKKEI